MNSEERIYNSSPALIRTALMNLHALRIERHRYGHPFRQALAELRALERSDIATIRQLQSDSLRRVLAHAARTDLYPELWAEHGVSPKGYGLDELQRLPILTRERLRAAGKKALTRPNPAADWVQGKTSGTTGSPLSLWYDREMCIQNNAADGLQKVLAGVAADDWIGMMLGRVVVPPRVKTPPFWNANYVQRQLWLSSFHLSATTLPLYVAEIQRRSLRFLEGYPSTLYTLAQFLVQARKTLPMTAVFTSSETLHAIQSETIEQAFQAPIYDYYGHAERAVFAVSCGRGEGKHVVEPYGYVEILDERGQPVPLGEQGYVVGTSLHNGAMPLLRYRTSDISSFIAEPCECGSTFRRIRDIATKAEDIVVLPDGRWISPSILTHPFKPFPEILKSQLVQETASDITVRVVVSDQFTVEMERALLDGLAGRLGESVSLRLERVLDIPRETSGKYRWVISRVPHSLRFQWDAAPGTSAEKLA